MGISMIGETLVFVSSNKNKARELEQILGVKIATKSVPLNEIQSLDPSEVAVQKAEDAFAQITKPLIVEDTGLFVDGKFGALVKFFSNEDLIKIGLGKTATAVSVFAYADGSHLFVAKGEIKGKIVEPRGSNGFGFDPIFQPDGYDKTFAEMTSEEKNRISMRRKAIEQLKVVLCEKNLI